MTEFNASWPLSQTLCYQRHLELLGRVSRVGRASHEPDGGTELWRLAQP